MFTTCSLACIVVAMATMTKVRSPVLACDWSIMCISVVNAASSVPAHTGMVRGVATDTLNQLTLTSGSDWLLKFWRFKTRKQEEQLKLNAAPASMRLHRDRYVTVSMMLAAARRQEAHCAVVFAAAGC